MDYDWVRNLFVNMVFQSAAREAVSGNSDIQKVSDCRGKRYIQCRFNKHIEAILAFGGLTYDDCIAQKRQAILLPEMAMGALDTCYWLGAPLALNGDDARTCWLNTVMM